MQVRIRSRSAPFIALLLASSANCAVGQGGSQQQRPLQPLGDVLHLVFDTDKDGKVSLDEVQLQINTLNMLVAGAEGQQGEDYRRILSGVKAAAPTIFDLLDGDSDQRLTKKELSYATKFEGSLQIKRDGRGGGMRDFIREIFTTLDTSENDELTAGEILAGCKSDEVITHLSKKLHELFPLRKSPGDLEGFVRSTIESLGGNALDEAGVIEGIKWIDADADGIVQRSEVGRYYKTAAMKFVEISKQIRQIGPMFAMLGGMDGMQGGSPGSSEL